jgi:hypothetical protein
MTALERQINELADLIGDFAKDDIALVLYESDARNLRALLAVLMKTKAELCECKRVLRELRRHPWKVASEISEMKGVKL